MLQFFRFNDPYRLLFVLLTVIVLGIKNEWTDTPVTIPEFNGMLVGEMMADGKSMYAEVWHSMPPVSAFVQYVHDLLFDRSQTARHITALILIFFQASFFGILLITNRAFNESNYLPAFVMVLISFFSFDNISITGEIVGTTLLLLAMNNLLKEIEFKRQRDETIHNLGLYLGLASLSVFSHLIFFVGVTVLLFIFTRIEPRRFGLYLVGFLLPHSAINLWYFWNDNLDLLWTNFYIANLDFSSQALMNSPSLLALSTLPIIFLILSLIMMRRDAHLTKYQSQIAQVMFIWLLLGLIEVFFNPQRTPHALLVCAPPMVYYISHYFLLIKRKWIAEIMIWVFIVGTITVNTLSSKNIISGVDFSKMIMSTSQVKIENKKILVLGDDLTPYIQNSTSTFFLDWKLSESIFQNPDVYQHVVYVASAFNYDPPDVIIDPQNNFERIIRYIPSISQHYRREGDNYVRVP